MASRHFDVTNYLHEEIVERSNSFIRRGKIFLGTKGHPNTYSGKPPIEECVTLPIPRKDDIMTLGIFAPSGSGKTQIKDRISHYLDLTGHNQVFFDPKSDYMQYALKNGCNYLLHPEEEPSNMDLELWIPSSIAHKRRKSKKFNVFSMKMEELTDQKDFSTLGFTYKSSVAVSNAMAIIQKRLNKGERITADMVKSVLASDSEIRSLTHFGSKQNAMGMLQHLIEERFFDEDALNLKLAEVWKRGNNPYITLMGGDEEKSAYYVGKLLADAYAVSLFQNTGQKFAWIDDAHLILSRDSERRENKGLDVIILIMALGREFGFNLGVLTQHPKLLHPSVHYLMQWQIYGKVDVSEVFIDPYVKYVIDNELYYNYSDFVKQFVLVKPDGRTFDKFYKWGPILGRQWGKVPLVSNKQLYASY